MKFTQFIQYLMRVCLVCNNSTQGHKFKSICVGCVSMLSHPFFYCKNCGVELQNQQNSCGSCQTYPPPFSEVNYVCNYQSPVDKWVMSLKFGDNIVITHLFAELMLTKIKHLTRYVLMPVPLHKSRLRKRGYNQAYEIAKEISKLSNFKINTDLIRVKNTAMQAELKLKERANNVSKAFKLNTPVKNKRIILIDDVMTSGNTLKECAKTLHSSGVKDVKVLIFARKTLS